MRVVRRLVAGVTAAIVLGVHRLSVVHVRVVRVMMHRLNHPRVVRDERLHARRPPSSHHGTAAAAATCSSPSRRTVSQARDSAERRRRRAGRGDVAPAALGTPAGVAALAYCGGCSRRRSTLAAAARLVLVLGELALVARLFLLGEAFPVALGLLVLLAPMLSNDLGNIWVRKAWILENHAGLVVLAV